MLKILYTIAVVLLIADAGCLLWWKRSDRTYWAFSFLVGVGGAVIFLALISWKWQKLMKPWDPLAYRLRTDQLNIISIMQPMLPHDTGLWSLKFSVIRHCLVFLAFAAVIFYVAPLWIHSVVTFVYLVYTGFVYLRYSSRRAILRETESDPEGQALAGIYRPLVQASRFVLIYSCMCAISLYLLELIHTVS